MRKICGLLAMLLCLSVSFVNAQANCSIDLEDSILRLVQAQRAADNGDILLATSLLQTVQNQIDNATAGCDRIRFTQQYTALAGDLIFAYPDDWQVQVLDRDVFIAASSPSVIDQFANDIPEDLQPGEAAIALQFQPLGSDSFDEIVDDALDDIQRDFSVVGNIEDSIYNGRRYLAFSIQISPSVSGRVGLIDFSDNEESPVAALVLGIGNSDSASIIDVYTDTLRQSIQYPPAESMRTTGISNDALSYSESISIDDLDADFSSETYLSPDGTQIAYEADDSICIFSIADESESCTALPDEAQRLTKLYWSPDGRYLAFHQDFFRMFIESDVWVYEVETRVLANLTDDGVDDYGFSGVEVETWLDATITWGPDNQIYILRIAAKPSDDGIEDAEYLLLKVDPNSGESTTVQDLSVQFNPTSIYDFGSYAFDGALSVSPDASQIAVSVWEFGENNSKNGVWIIDLIGGEEPQQVVSVSDFLPTIPAEMADALDALRVAGIAWDAEGDGLFTFSVLIGGFPITIVNHIDLATGDVVDLINLSGFTREELTVGGDDGEPPFVLNLPSDVTLTSDFKGLITVNQIDGTASIVLYEFDGQFSEPTALYEIEDPQFGPGGIQIGQNGNLLYARFLLINE